MKNCFLCSLIALAACANGGAGDTRAGPTETIEGTFLGSAATIRTGNAVSTGAFLDVVASLSDGTGTITVDGQEFDVTSIDNGATWRGPDVVMAAARDIGDIALNHITILDIYRPGATIDGQIHNILVDGEASGQDPVATRIANTLVTYQGHANIDFGDGPPREADISLFAKTDIVPQVAGFVDGVFATSSEQLTIEPAVIVNGGFVAAISGEAVLPVNPDDADGASFLQGRFFGPGAEEAGGIVQIIGFDAQGTGAWAANSD